MNKTSSQLNDIRLLKAIMRTNGWETITVSQKYVVISPKRTAPATYPQSLASIAGKEPKVAVKDKVTLILFNRF